MLEEGDYVVNIDMSKHHFLVMAFYLVRVPGLNQLRKVLKHLNSFSFEL